MSKKYNCECCIHYNSTYRKCACPKEEIDSCPGAKDSIYNTKDEPEVKIESKPSDSCCNMCRHYWSAPGGLECCTARQTSINSKEITECKQFKQF